MTPRVRWIALVAAAGACGVVHADATRSFAAPVADVRHAWAVLADSSAVATEPRPARAAYVPSRTYAAAGCLPGRVYWRRSGGPPPSCASTQWVQASGSGESDGMRCMAAQPGLRDRGWHAAGRLRQWDGRALQWTVLEAGARGAIECEDDRARHGAAAGSWYAADGGGAPWTSVADAEIAWDEHATTYTLYDANYVAWWHGATAIAARSWREVQATAIDAALAWHGGPSALLRHSWNRAGADDDAAEGGMVVLAGPGGPATGAAAANLLRDAPFGGGAPLAETLDETARLFRADALRFGLAAHAAPTVPQPSIAQVRSPADRQRYASPVPTSCSRAHVTMLGAAPPAQDANVRAVAWPDAAPPDCNARVAGDCAARYAARLPGVDASPWPGRQDFAVDWRVDARHGGDGAWSSALVGASPMATAADALAPVLAAHARQALHAGALARPADATPQITAVVSRGGATYAALAVPSRHARWSGGLRRVRLDPRTGAPRVATSADMAQLPPPAERRVYTDVAGELLTDAANRVSVDNARIDAGALGLDDANPATRAALVRWLRGTDVDDVDADGDRIELRDAVGAVLGTPAIVHHPGGRTRVYAGTGDGLLHAFDAGLREAWAYVPAAFLARAAMLRQAGASDRRIAGIDGDLRLHMLDRDADGRIDVAAGERAILLFGLRRGGRAYRAVDVSDPDAPRVLWTLTSRELPGLAQTWAAPVAARLTIAGARQNAARSVVLLAGGHDPAQDPRRPRPRDRIGAALYLVDAFSGALLWHAAGVASAAPDLQVEGLDYGIAATPRALDLDDDGELDRAYVADTGGRVFRFEFVRGAPRRALARATLLAELGGVGAADRRFYAEPDVALVRHGLAAPYAAVTLGSGFAADPMRAGVVDRLYSLRDPLPGRYRTTAALPPISDGELPDAADAVVPATARGWKRRLGRPGEQVTGPVRTIDHAAYVPTWTPPSPTRGADCVQPAGSNRLRIVDVRDGRPRAFRVIEAPDADEPDALRLPGGGIAAPLAVARLPPAERCGRSCGPRVAGLAGGEPVPIGWPGTIVRAGWAERGIE